MGTAVTEVNKVYPILIQTHTNWTGQTGTGTGSVPFVSRGGQRCTLPRTHTDVEGEEEDAVMNRYPGIGTGAASVGTEMGH